MRDEHQRARELEQALLQHLERRDVEVVGGLVEEQHVGRLEHQLRDQHARLLAAGQPADRRVELLGAEQEALGPAGHVDRPVLEDHRVAVRRQRALQRERRIEPRAVLVEHDDAQVRRAARPCPRPASRCSDSRRSSVVLPLPLRAEQAEPHAGRQHEVEVADDRAVAERLAQALRDQQALRLALGPAEVDADRLRARARVEVGQLLAAAARPRRCAPAPCACAPWPCATATRARRARGCAATPGTTPGPPAARPSSPGTRCSGRAPRACPRRTRGSARSCGAATASRK